MLGSNWKHEEVPHESSARVWVFGSFFPFFSLHHSRSTDRLSLSLSSSLFPSHLAPLSFSLRGFGLLVSVHLPAHSLFYSQNGSLFLFPSSGSVLRLCAPQAPDRQSYHWERESEPNLTWSKHPPHHVLPSTPTSRTILCGSQRRNGGVHRLAGGKYVIDHVHCVNTIFTDK